MRLRRSSAQIHTCSVSSVSTGMRASHPQRESVVESKLRLSRSIRFRSPDSHQPPTASIVGASSENPFLSAARSVRERSTSPLALLLTETVSCTATTLMSLPLDRPVECSRVERGNSSSRLATSLSYQIVFPIVFRGFDPLRPPSPFPSRTSLRHESIPF